MPLWLNTLVICRLPCLPGASALHFRFSTWAWSRAFLPAELPERGQGGRKEAILKGVFETQPVTISTNLSRCAVRHGPALLSPSGWQSHSL